MYIVKWCDCEGNLHERKFRTIRAARAEADERDAGGEIVAQWLGDGKSAYPLAGLPVMDVENICAMFDITEKKREKLVMRETDVPGSMNWEDTAPLERPLYDPKLCVRYDGMDLLPLKTSAGVTFIQEKYLLPLDGLEYMRLYERRGRNGDLFYIVAKIGMIIQAVIMPMKLPDENFMDLLEDLTLQCRDAMRKRALVPKQEYVLEREPEPLFQVDENTGEIVEEGEGE